MDITIANKRYDVTTPSSPEEMKQGLRGVDHLDDDKGMLFIIDPPRDVSFTMRGMSIPLDIIFIDEDQEVIKVETALPEEDSIMCRDVAYVLEVNPGSGIKRGDMLELEDDEPPVMKILAPDGSTLADLWGGERIVSRAETKVLVRKARKADKTKADSDYRSLGKYMFKVLKGQDDREPEYVQTPS